MVSLVTTSSLLNAAETESKTEIFLVIIELIFSEVIFSLVKFGLVSTIKYDSLIVISSTEMRGRWN